MYTYQAKVIKVTDGDTIRVDIDLGFGIWSHHTAIRLARINAPEIKGPEKEQGNISKEWLKQKILNQTVLITTKRDSTEKYGRYLAEVWLGETNINDLLVIKGMASYRNG